MPPRLASALLDSPVLAPMLHAYREVRRRLRDRRPVADPFIEIYANRLWKSDESVSGAGSTLAETTHIRGYLPGLLRRLGARSLLDLPCGDFHWMRTLDLPVERYVGADIVPDLIAGLQATYGSPGREFLVLDATADPLPRVDAILNRHCLIHLSNRRALAALLNFRRSGARWLLTTSCEGLERNVDIETGSFRPIDLGLAPFNLPSPVEALPDSGDGKGWLKVYDLHAWTPVQAGGNS